MASGSTLLIWTDAAGQTDFIAFDVVTNETHEATVDVTEFPVEEGTDVADNARPAPERITVEGYVSLKPMASNPGVDFIGSFRSVGLPIKRVAQQGSAQIKIESASRKLTANLLGLERVLAGVLNPAPKSYQGRAPIKIVDDQVHARLFGFDTFTNRCRQVAEKLEFCRLNAVRIRVETTLRDYDDMVIEREAEPRTPEDGGGVTFQIDLKRIRTVRSQTVDAPKPAEARGAARESKGSKAGEKDANQDGKRAKLKSALAASADALTGG